MRGEMIKKIKENTKIGEDILFKIVEWIRPGVATYKLNEIAKQEFRKYNALPSAKFYNLDYYLSMAINEELLFGEISKKKKIKEGDLIKLSLGIFKEGYCSDLALTLGIGKLSSTERRLIKVTAQAMDKVISILKNGLKVQKISMTIENTFKKYRLNPICEIMGHGIGKNLHEPPVIPNCQNLPFVDYDFKLKKNTIVCIEPLATTGSGKLIRKDKVRFIMKDKKPSTHFEFPILIKDKGNEVLGKRIFEYIKSLK